MFRRLFLLLLCLPLAAHADDGVPDTVRDEAWFTGSLNSTGANALPEGHFLAEPYLGEAIAPSSRTLQSFNLLLYGVTDALTVGIVPRFSWRDRAGIGDLTARVQYRFTDYDGASGRPALALAVNQDLPTGRYDRLGTADATGSGAYTTHLSLLADDYLAVDGRPRRLRLNLSAGAAPPVGLEGRSVYGTPDGFGGRARPGLSYDATFALEYSLSTRWAAALDLSYDRADTTRIDGAAFHTALPVAQSADLVPALEYNWTAYTGLIVGAQLPVWRHGTPRVIVPLAALNCVF